MFHCLSLYNYTIIILCLFNMYMCVIVCIYVYGLVAVNTINELNWIELKNWLAHHRTQPTGVCLENTLTHAWEERIPNNVRRLASYLYRPRQTANTCSGREKDIVRRLGNKTPTDTQTPLVHTKAENIDTIHRLALFVDDISCMYIKHCLNNCICPLKSILRITRVGYWSWVYYMYMYTGVLIY